MENYKNLKDLLVLSDIAANDMEEAEREAMFAEIDRDEQELVWASIAAKLIEEEDIIDPPGGGRWNDEKRQLYLVKNYHENWDRLCEKRKAVKKAEGKLKILKARVSGINRAIRILGLVVPGGIGDDTDA